AGNAQGDDFSFWNGYGGFSDEGRKYVVRLSGDTVTPHPWVNVIANETFGFHTSSEGASWTWSRNSRDFQLTPWSNDPVTDRPGEAFYIRDLDSGEVFSPQACVLRAPSLVYEARHGRGFSCFSAQGGDIASELTQLVDPQDPVKIQRLSLTNRRATAARLRVYGYAEWVMGSNRIRTAPLIVPGLDAASGVLT